jgi:hypothetical protein
MWQFVKSYFSSLFLHITDILLVRFVFNNFCKIAFYSSSLVRVDNVVDGDLGRRLVAQGGVGVVNIACSGFLAHVCYFLQFFLFSSV